MSLRTKRVTGLATIILVAGTALSLGMAQPEEAEPVAVETLLPERATIYVGMDGTAAHEETWEQTAAYAALYDSGLMDVIANAADSIEGVGNNQATLALNTIKHGAENGFSFALTLGDGGLAPWAIAVLHDGADLEEPISEELQVILANVSQFETKEISGRTVTQTFIPNTPAVQIGWWAEGDHLVVVAGMNAVDSAIRIAEGDSNNITASKLWKAYLAAEADFEVSNVAWLDFASIRKTFGAFPIPLPPRQDANVDAENGDEEAKAAPQITVGELAKLLGLDTLNSVVRRSGFKGDALWSQTVVDAPGKRRGLMALAEQETFTLDQLPPLPKDSTGFVASSWDWSKGYDVILDVAHKLEPLFADEGSIDGVIEQMNEHLTINLRDDLLEPLGNIHCFYGDSAQVPFGLGFGVAISVDDADKLRETIITLIEVAQEESRGAFFAQTVEKQEREILLISAAGGMVTPALCVDEKWLSVGFIPQSVQAFLMRLDGDLDSWKPTEDLQAALGEVPTEFTAITVMDPRQSYQMAVGLGPFAVGMVQGIMRQFGINPEAISVADLPPAELVTRPLFPNLSVAVSTKDGITYTSRESLPAMPFFGGAMDGGTAVATSGVLVALLLPAVQQAREAARRTQSRNNLKQIGLAMHNFHDVHKSFPAGTVENEDLEPEERLSWLVSILPYIDQAPLYNVIDQEEGWESEQNKEALAAPVPVFLNPGVTTMEDTELGQTHYVGIAGVGEKGPTLDADDPKAGMFAYHRVTDIREITDGTSNTMAVAESNRPGPWGAGGDSTIRALTQKPYINGPDGIGGPFQGGCNVLFADGSVRFVSENIDPDTFEALSTISGGEVIGDF